MPSDYDPDDDLYWEDADVGYNTCKAEEDMEYNERCENGDDGSDSPDEGDEEDLDEEGWFVESERRNNANYSNAVAEGSNNDDKPDESGSSGFGQTEEARDEPGQAGSMSKSEYTKPWGGTGGFMDSYGIERTPEGYQEANELVDTMREAAEKEVGGGGGGGK